MADCDWQAWLCGASLWITPCSRVGHVFRDVVPYTFPLEGGAVTTVRHNAARVAETWLGRYKYFYYATQVGEKARMLTYCLTQNGFVRGLVTKTTKKRCFAFVHQRTEK